jgi:tRNA threonylcarbamoyladenosine biosynthesis protein TsaE
MPEIDRISTSPEETTELGRELARRLTAPMLILLSGDLGSGKTTLTKGIISGLGAAREEDVTSPTFTLVHVFRNNGKNGNSAQADAQSRAQSKIYHVDLYRVEDFHDLETLALEDALSEPAIVIIEWSERFSLRSDWPRIVIRLEHLEGDTRHIVISDPVPAESTAPHL